MGLEAYRFMRADFAMALEHGQRAATIAARSGDTKQRLHAHWGLACTLFHKGSCAQQCARWTSALALYTPQLHRLFGVQDPGDHVHGVLVVGAVGAWAAPMRRWRASTRRVAIAREFEHKFSQAVALAYGVSIELLRGETEAALARAEVCIRVCEEFGFPVWLAITRCMRGRLLCEQGRLRRRPERDARGPRHVALDRRDGLATSLPLAAHRGTPARRQTRSAAGCVDEGLDIIDATASGSSRPS